MATATDELAALKIRAAKGESLAKITLIDHTAGKRTTCTVQQAIGTLAWLCENEKSHHSIHIVDYRQEKERKLKNPQNSTKRILNCRTPEQWKELNAVLEPFYEEAKDPHIALDLIIRSLAAVKPETIRAWLAEVAEELPDFLR